MFQVGDALADLNSFHARDRHDIAREHRFRFVPLEPAEREQLRDFGWLHRAVQFCDADFRAARKLALEHARDRNASQIFAIVEIRHLNLQRLFGITRRRRNGGDDLFKQRLKVRRRIADLVDAPRRAAHWCKARENRAGLRWRRDR